MDNATLFRERKEYTIFHILLKPHLPALFLLPRTSPPYPALFFLHHYRGSKENIVFFASEAARKNFAVLAIDMEYHGERRVDGQDILSTDLEADYKAFLQTFEDALCALQFLERYEDIRRGEIFFLGVSLGALVGAVVSALYGKFKGIALVVGGGNIEILLTESMLDSIVNIRYALRKQGIPIREVATSWKDLDPLYAARKIIRTPTFLFNATQDTIVPGECALELYRAIHAPKEILWFHAEHDLFYLPKYHIPQRIFECFTGL
ncbi:alpha/beta hydrolase [Candidatus Caldatribacterium sp.]|uniref:alpha/beta hydrolase n=1 Tax=Candidatus Caldatribacterium sp. TaxID=2282143 RepID=UPI002993C782|nr:alpha/beta hydrolase [Candidatus Caldatribacterium sp.]MDW8082041.1 alpha/beta hydrolase [Candidatus Calescibacterium sp.]